MNYEPYETQHELTWEKARQYFDSTVLAPGNEQKLFHFDVLFFAPFIEDLRPYLNHELFTVDVMSSE